MSTGSRASLIEHLDTTLPPLAYLPGVTQIYADAKRPGVMDRGTAGQNAREALGWKTVHAPGTNRELGVLALHGETMVLLINASASQRDLGQDANAFVAVVSELVLSQGFRGLDPHLPAEDRPTIFAPFADRFIRDQELGWRLFNVARAAVAVFSIAGKSPLDTLSPDSETSWMMYAWEGASAKTTTVTRLTGGELNLYRVGLHGGAQVSLPRGFRWQHEAMPDGTWRRATDESHHPRSVIKHHPEPDPETWWEVQVLVRAALDPTVTTWRELARRMGEAGLLARGVDEHGVPVDRLADPRSASKLSLHPSKLQAYRTGELAYERIGVGGGLWTLPGGHKFLPRWPGDERGSVRYQVQLGLPEWPRGFTDDDLDAVAAKWWPAGSPRRNSPGRATTNHDRRAMAGVMAWQTPGARHEVLGHAGRYDWRAQNLAVAPRRADGTPADLRLENSTLMASWFDHELATHVADFLDGAVRRLLTQHPDADLAPLSVHRPAPSTSPSQARRAREDRELRNRMQELAEQADGAERLAGLLAARGEDEAALAQYDRGRALHHEAATLGSRIAAAAEGVERHSRTADGTAQRAGADATAGGPHTTALDISTVAGLVAALRGPFGSGPQAVELNAAVRAYLAEPGLRFERIDGDVLAVRLTGAARFRLTDGSLVDVPHQLTLPSRIPDRSKADRLLALTRAFMRDGQTLEGAAAAARSHATRDNLRRWIDDVLSRRIPDTQSTSTGARLVLRPGYAPALLDAPAELRRLVWNRWSGGTDDANVSPPFLQLIVDTYLTTETAGSAATGKGSGTTEGDGDDSIGDATSRKSGPRVWLRAPGARHRALTVLLSHPVTAHQGMTPQHLASASGLTGTQLLALGAARRNHTRGVDVPVLARAHGPARSPLAPSETKGRATPGPISALTPLRCPHPDATGHGRCNGLHRHVALTPEMDRLGAATLCEKCLRPANSAVAFPSWYVQAVAARTPALAGQWVACAYQECRVDAGAGAGLVWQWLDPGAVAASNPEGTTPVGAGQLTAVWHGPDCRARRAVPEELAPREVRRCGYRDCDVDEGSGPGIVPVTAGAARRRWHTRACAIAEARVARGQARAEDRIDAPGRPCRYADCRVDEGRGPGMLDRVRDPLNGPGRRWHSRDCLLAAGRADRRQQRDDAVVG
ncbi:hypothetical protein [Jannaschia sp. R86511]|uniref:hypothetical protein n=1 Tax=Jannaschia sp. R86511 TaxID=3093853 RepID=UPI0036D209B6